MKFQFLVDFQTPALFVRVVSSSFHNCTKIKSIQQYFFLGCLNIFYTNLQLLESGIILLKPQPSWHSEVVCRHSCKVFRGLNYQLCFDHSGLPPYLISPRDTFSPTGYDPWGIGPIPGVSGLWNGGTKIPSMYRQ